jgi:hypothetical protein
MGLPRGWTAEFFAGVGVGFIGVPMSVSVDKARERVLRGVTVLTEPTRSLCVSLAASITPVVCPEPTHAR